MLLRKSLDTEQRASLFQTSATAARLVISCADQPLSLKLKRHRRQNTAFASLLSHVPKPPQGSKSCGPQVNLTLTKSLGYCLPKDYVTRLCLRKMRFTREEWRACLVALQEYRRLRTLALESCLCTDVDMYVKPSEPVTLSICELEVANKPEETCTMTAVTGLITGEYQQQT